MFCCPRPNPGTHVPSVMHCLAVIPNPAQTAPIGNVELDEFATLCAICATRACRGVSVRPRAVSATHAIRATAACTPPVSALRGAYTPVAPLETLRARSIWSQPCQPGRSSLAANRSSWRKAQIRSLPQERELLRIGRERPGYLRVRRGRPSGRPSRNSFTRSLC